MKEKAKRQERKKEQMKTTEQVKAYLEQAQRRAALMSEILTDYIKELAARDGKLYDARVTRIKKYFKNNSGDLVHYTAIIDAINSTAAWLDVYACIIDENTGYMKHGTNQGNIQGAYLGERLWVTSKEGKTKDYFTAAPMIAKVQELYNKLQDNRAATAETIKNINMIGEQLAQLQKQLYETAGKINDIGRQRAYFENKNLNELFEMKAPSIY